jgi:hypothetical protein
VKFYISTKDTWKSLSHLMTGAHYIDLPSGEILVAAEFRDANHGSKFSNHPLVTPLPHPGRLDTMAKHPKALQALQHLGVKAAHSVMDVSDIVSAIHPLMSLEF